MATDRLRTLLHRVEEWTAAGVLLLTALLPAIESVLRKTFQTGILAGADYVQHLVIWITFVGGMITSRHDRHLALTAGVDRLPHRWRNRVRTITAAVAAAVAAVLAVSAWRFATLAFEPGARVGLLPLRPAMMVMPAGFAVMAVRFALHAPDSWLAKIVGGAGAVLGLAIGVREVWVLPPALVWLGIATLVAAALLGAPVFVALGGAAAILFAGAGGSSAVIANEAYTMLSGAVIPTIPLFALTGFILSESRAGERLVGFFQAACGWLPGGLAIMAVAVCAFFTTFTGASGVTILALGGLLFYVLTQSHYERGFSTGLLTASGSIGLLFPPSLPIILYGVVAQVDIKRLFVAGLLPGTVMIAAVAMLGVRHAMDGNVVRTPFNPRELARALSRAAWELALPFLILFLYLRGFTTIVETSAIAVVYALFVAVVVRRDIPPRAIIGVVLKCVPTVGGILVILAVARGLSYYIVDAELPTSLANWCKTHIANKYVFLALLNVVLLVVGCFMDIFSATVVVVPLLVPLGRAYGLDPIHIGIIFLANLELGYLTPPVGINLFLSSYRFETPLAAVYRHTVPFLLALAVAVVLITYVPWITTGLVELIALSP